MENTTARITEVYALRDYVDKNGKPAKYACMEGSVLPYNLNNFINEAIEKGFQRSRFSIPCLPMLANPAIFQAGVKCPARGNMGHIPLHKSR